MKTYEEIYREMCDKGDHRYSIREVLSIFEKEDGNWVADTQQSHELKTYQLELTGFRPGSCSNCMIEVVKNMINWVNRYEKEHPEVLKEAFGGVKTVVMVDEASITKFQKRKRGF